MTTAQPCFGTKELIDEVCEEIKQLLHRKNDQYGDSAINPIRIFSKAPTDEQIKVRIDDKLSRLVRGNDALESDEEIINDLIGYFIMLKVAKRKEE